MNVAVHPAEAAAASAKITAVIAEHLEVLRRIGAGERWETKVAMAQAFGRNDGPNMTKTLKLLHADGAITGWDDLAVLALTPLGEAAIRWGDFAEGKTILPGHAMVALNRLRPNPNNPRKDFTSPAARADQDQLKASIRQHGVKQAPLCRLPDAEGVYELVFGECRWRACGDLQAEGHYPADWELLVKVEDLTDEQADSLAFLENKARRNLSYTEEAHAFRRMIDAHGWDHERIRAEWGYDTRKTVQDRLRLLTLPQDVLDKLNAGDLTWRAVREMFQVHKAPKADEPEAAGLFDGEAEEPGSAAEPAPAEPALLDLSPKAALIVVELAAKAAAEQIPGMEPNWVRIASIPEGGAAAELVRRQIVMFANQHRVVGAGPFAKLMVHTSGVTQWLEAQGFYDGPTFRKLLLEARRAEVIGEKQAAELAEESFWATLWLNVGKREEEEPSPPPEEPAGTPPEAAEPQAPRALTLGQMAQEDAKAVGEMARGVNERMAAIRVKAAGKWHWSTATVEELEERLAEAIGKGAAIDTATLLTMLMIRAGAMGACHSLMHAVHILDGERLEALQAYDAAANAVPLLLEDYAKQGHSSALAFDLTAKADALRAATAKAKPFLRAES